MPVLMNEIEILENSQGKNVKCCIGTMLKWDEWPCK